MQMVVFLVALATTFPPMLSICWVTLGFAMLSRPMIITVNPFRGRSTDTLTLKVVCGWGEGLEYKGHFRLHITQQTFTNWLDVLGAGPSVVSMETAWEDGGVDSF